MMLIMQSKAQLRDRDLYGPDKAAAILDNCGLEVVFGTKDNELATELSKRLGYDTVEARSRSGPAFWRVFRRDRLSLTESDRRAGAAAAAGDRAPRPRQAILMRPGMLPDPLPAHPPLPGPDLHPAAATAPEVPPITIEVRLDQGKGFEVRRCSCIPSSLCLIECSPSSVGCHPPCGLGCDSPRVKPHAPPKPRTPPAKTSTAATKTPPAVAKTALDQPVKTPASRARAIPDVPVLKPHQSDALVTAILGTDIDLSRCGLPDGKAAVIGLLAAIPTVESLGRGAKSQAT